MNKQSRSGSHSQASKNNKEFRAIWISDVHLGFRGARADLLLDFLHRAQCEKLYLVGDIVDMWSMKKRPYWPQSHNDVIRTILGKAKYGTEVIYVPGNHDELLRAYVGHEFGNISIQDPAIHVRRNGEKMLVLHGDQFDAAVASSRWIGMLGSLVYELLLGANTILNRARRAFGFPYWSLAKFLKNKVKNAVQYISIYERAVAEAARRYGVSGVVCGHIHRAEVITIDGILYCNCGDWVEGCTALVEHDDGHIELVDWSLTENLPLHIKAAA
ncbi:MAG: UDP-2,3-diacylglucosamine diphosphatase [Pseudomonadota bacterium]